MVWINAFNLAQSFIAAYVHIIVNTIYCTDIGLSKDKFMNYKSKYEKVGVLLIRIV